MAEFVVDLIIDKSIKVFAASPEEARKKAVTITQDFLKGDYDSIYVDGVQRMEDEE